MDDRITDLLTQLNQHKKIRFNTRQGFVMLDPSDIVYCQADWSYTELWFSKEKKEAVTMNIGTIEKILPEGQFAKISRSQMINRQYIEKFDRKIRLMTIRKVGEVFSLKVEGSMVKGSCGGAG
jgi:DNA-binding LytR/AlgR family response regulator